MIKNYISADNKLVSNFIYSFLFSFIFIFPNFIFSQTDNCDLIATAGELQVGSSCMYTPFNNNSITNYWQSPNGCDASNRDDSWGWFKAVGTTTIINYKPDSNKDVILHLFTGSCSPTMTALACSNNYGTGGVETIAYNTIIGQKYMIRIQANGNNGVMNGEICVYATNLPVISNFNPTAACAGSTITINGFNFQNATSVKIGNTPATILSSSATSITVTVGSGTTGTVTVTTPLGTTTSTDVFTVYNIPTIISNPINSTITIGANTTFSATASNNPTSYLWQVSTNGGTTWTTVTNGGVYTNASTATLNITGATSLMNGYLYRVNATNICGSSSFSSAGLLTVTGCIPLADNPSLNYISQVAFIGNITNPPANNSTYSNAPAGYQNFTNLPKATQAQGEGVNISINSESTTTSNNYLKAWVDWNKNSIFESNELVYQCETALNNTSFGFQIPATTIPGDYTIRIRINSNILTNNSFDACTYYPNNPGETEDYAFTVLYNCSAKILSVNDNFSYGTGSVELKAIGENGTIEYRWYTQQTGGTYIATSSELFNTPVLTNDTTYYVTAYNGTCESLYRTPVLATIKSVPVINLDNENPKICGDNNIIALNVLGANQKIILVDEKFEGTTNSFSNVQINSPNSSITNWQIRSSTYVPSYSSISKWFPAISSSFGSNKFMMSSSDLSTGQNTSGKVNEALELTNSVNTSGFSNLTLTFKMFFSSYYDSNDADTEGVFIEANTGSGWTTIATYLTDQGSSTKFKNETISLNNFTNVNSLKIRIRYRASWCHGVAIDDIQLFGEKFLTPNITWSSGTYINAFLDNACTIPYAQGNEITNLFIKPTILQLENSTYSFTVNANLENGCTVSRNINVINNTKLWKGTINTDWNNPNNWSPVGVPTIENCITIPDVVAISGNGYNAYGKEIKVKNVGTLTVNEDNNLTIADGITVEQNGVFELKNNANLVQLNDVINSGKIIYNRTANNIIGTDFVYWSSPVNNQLLNAAFSGTTSGSKYSWNTTINNSNGGQGNWVNANNSIMNTATGYIVRGSSSSSMPASNINTSFIGVPNNGTILKSISRGTYTGNGYNGTNGQIITNLSDNYNLIGNPYPSAINALDFLNDNSSVLTTGIKLWSHSSNPSSSNNNPFYGTFSYNYSTNDYITLNLSGATNPGITDYIKAGQAFFVIMQDGTANTSDVIFKNSYRTNINGLVYPNNNFFKNSSNKNNITEINDSAFERHRIWLDIVDSNNNSNRALIAYASGATMAEDNLYDAFSPVSSFRLYSLINDKEFLIQGRALPFSNNDQVPLGFEVATAGTYNIAINTIDGLFDNNQNIYLKDELLNVFHNLKTTPYSFTTTSGSHNDRFKIVYNTNDILSTNPVNNSEYEIQISKFEDTIEIVSGNQSIENVKIYDLNGRLIIEKDNIQSNNLSIDTKNIEDQALIINVITDENIKISKKVL